MLRSLLYIRIQGELLSAGMSFTPGIQLYLACVYVFYTRQAGPEPGTDRVNVLSLMQPALGCLPVNGV